MYLSCVATRLTLHVASGLLATAWLATTALSRDIDFTRDIRPILSNKCYACHGPDEGTRKAGLRLDHRNVATSPLESGTTAIVPGDAEKSEMVRRIFHADEGLRMPPADAKYTLTGAEKALLTSWVEQGAAYSLHWSFLPPVRPELPEVSDASRIRNEIDHFVLARLDRQNIQPSEEACKEQLLRRLSLDLRGLPPSVAEVDAFLADESDMAYARAVDKMLGSIHFGEKMAQGWLDLARYGDTNGYHSDSHRDMWLYRDWVIHAFHSNMPFDQFVREQIAGDLLPHASSNQHIASAFNRNAPFNEEGGADPDEFYVAYAIDRANTTGQALLGLTFGCAQCHSHKYDPISQEEYYEFLAFFNSVHGEIGGGGENGHHGKPVPPTMAAPSPLRALQLSDLNRKIAKYQAHFEAQLYRAVDRVVRDKESWFQWALDTRRHPVSKTLPVTDGLTLHLDATDINGNRVPDAEEVYQPPETIGQWRDLSSNGYHASGRHAPAFVPPGNGGQPSVRFDGKEHLLRTESGGQQLSGDFTIMAAYRPRDNANHQMLVMWGNETQGQRRALWLTAKKKQFSFNGYSADVVGSANMTPNDGYIGLITRSVEPPAIRLVLNGRPAGDGNPSLRAFDSDAITIGANNAGKEHASVDFNEIILYNRSLSEDEQTTVGAYLSAKYELQTSYASVPQQIAQILEGEPGDWTPKQQLQLARYYVQSVEPDSKVELQRLRRMVKEATARRDRVQNRKATVMVMKAMAVRKPTFVLNRGDFQQPGKQVLPNVPDIFPPLDADLPGDRLALARWLTDPKHPLVSRVRVNHIWKQFLGHGLVRTPGDFGTQGELPTHPELLDWLAVEFIESGWNTKSLIKMIVMSATYRQNSSMKHSAVAKDPENRLLYRAPRYRLSAEEIRDMALTTSGRLDRTIGGPSVRPYQPPNYFSSTSGRRWNQSRGSDSLRRGLYTYWQRTAPYAAFVIFDAPSRQLCTARRPRTNTPLQALVTLNDPVFLDASRSLGQHVAHLQDTSDDDKLIFLWRRVLGRTPKSTERSLLTKLLSEQRSAYAEDFASAELLIGKQSEPRRSEADVRKLAAWTNLASVLLNLDESITRE